MTLTIQDLGALGELLGSVAVLVTLIYLALQTRQNTKAIDVQVEAARFNSVIAITTMIATSNGLADALKEDMVEETTTTNDLLRMSFWISTFQNFDWQFTHATGFNAARMWPVVGALFTDSRGFGSWWDRAKGGGGFSPEFVEWVEERRAKAA